MTLFENPIAIRFIALGKNLIEVKKYRKIAVFITTILLIIAILPMQNTTTKIMTYNDMLTPFAKWVFELLLIILAFSYVSQTYIAIICQWAFESIGLKNATGKLQFYFFTEKTLVSFT